MTHRVRRGRDWLLLDVLVPVSIRVVEMGVALLLISLRNQGGPSLVARLTPWDAAYYGDIATHGYPERIVLVGTELRQGARFAFAPLYPVLVAVVRVFGVSTADALVAVAVASGLAASVAVHFLARRVVGNRRAGYVACALLGALPMAVTLQMGYAESLAIALSAVALLQAIERRWWWAAGFAFAAGLTRPTAAAVALAIPAAAWAARRGRSIKWRNIGAATVVGLSGTPLFWLYVWIRSGVPDGWFIVQKYGWKSRFDLGSETIKFFGDAFDKPDRVMAVFALVSIVGFVMACAAALWRGLSPPLVAVTIVSVALVLGSSNYWHSKPRLLLAGFPLVVLAARPLSKLSTNTLLVGLTAGVFVSAWFGAYALVVWPYAI